MKNKVNFRSRKLITPLLAGILTISLSGCIPSGNVVGKASFITFDSSFASSGAPAQVEVNGGVVATPKGLRFRINKAKLSVNGVSIVASPDNYLESEAIFPRDEFANSRLKGRNICATVGGLTVDGIPFVMYLTVSNAGSQNLSIYFLNNDLYTLDYWIGEAPDNSLKIGGRNLCAYAG